MTRVGTGERLGLSPEQMRERCLRQKRESEARRRAARRDEVLQQKRDEQRRNRAGYRRRQQEWRSANPEAHHEQLQRHSERSPEKAAARRLAQTVPLGPCEVCGVSEDVHRHHDDYSRPTDVRLLCRRHHNEVHHG